MLGTIAKTIRNLLLIAYSVATALGLIYAYQYYAVFDIEFFNFATPLDLLLIALANPGKVLLIALLAVSATLLAILLLTLIILMLRIYALVKTAVLIYIVAVRMLLKAMVLALYFVSFILAVVLALPLSMLLTVPVLCIFVLTVAFGSLRCLFLALRTDEHSRHGGFRNAYAAAKADHPLVRLDRFRIVLDFPFRLGPVASSKMKEVISDFGEILFDFHSKVEDYFETASDNVHYLWDWFLKNWKDIFLIGLGLISLYVASASGTVDAELIVYNKPESNLWEAEYLKAIVDWPLEKNDDRQGRPEAKVFVVPTLNLASLEFLSDCGCAKTDDSDSNATAGARKYVHATIRQDAGGTGLTNLPSCLVHVGATDSAQFLLDFGDSCPFPLDDGSRGGADALSGSEGSTPSASLREKLDSSLLSLVESYEDGGSEAALAYAKSSGLDFGERRVSVHVFAASEQGIDFLKQRIVEIGGKVESSFENSVFASMPVDALRTFAAGEAVWRVEAQRSLFSPPSPAEPVAENPQDAKEGEE